MLCSNCSHEIKPIVAVDIDGTLGNYHGHFISFALRYTGKNDGFKGLVYGYDGSVPFREWFCWTFDTNEKTWHDVKLAYRQGGMKRTMPIFPGARELCNMIKKSGAELWITTTRPYLSLDNIVPDTVEWCRRHGISYDGMLFDELKYEEFAKRIDTERVCAIVDDLEEMCEAASKVMHFGRDVPILAYNGYNSAMRWPCYAPNLFRAAEIVSARIEHWRESYAS